MKTAKLILDHFKNEETLSRLGLEVLPENIELIPLTSKPRPMQHKFEDQKFCLIEKTYKIELVFMDVKPNLSAFEAVEVELIRYLGDNSLYDPTLEAPDIDFDDNVELVDLTINLELSECVYGVEDEAGKFLIDGTRYNIAA